MRRDVWDYDLGSQATLVDMPGGVGFAADGLNALLAADMAVVVLDPAPERAALAEPVLRRLDELGLPHVIVINKIEHARAGTVHALIEQLQPMSREPLALRQIPIREGDAVVGYVDLALERAYRYRPGKESERVAIPGDIAALEQRDRSHLLETLADFDDALMEALLMDEAPDQTTIMADLATDTQGNQSLPSEGLEVSTSGGAKPSMWRPASRAGLRGASRRRGSARASPR